jgi:carbamoyl-phosphate synthase large subunit
MNYNVLVTGIGGNVGQGILRNLSSMNCNLRLIGTNTKYLSAGNHLCDKVYETPFADDNEYVSAIKRISDNEQVHLIIPSTDYECYYLSVIKNREILPTVATSPEKTNKIFIDKYLTWRHFTANDIPFAQSCLPSKYQDEYKYTIVKPREGRGSRNVFFDPENPKEFDDGYIVQKRYFGQEITTAFYVKNDNTLHGYITLSRKLESGTTNMCEVTHAYDKQILNIINKMMINMEIRGSCNIQSIVTEDNEIFPFEINGRISGTNSIRSQFGFKDIQYTIDEYLLKKIPEPVVITKGCAIRILIDVIYPEKMLHDVKNQTNNHYYF